MITAHQNETFEAVVDGASTGLVGTITFEIYDPTDASVIVATRTTGISEPRPGSYVTTASIPTSGTYNARWTYASGGFTNVAEEEIVVGDVNDASVRPSMEQVALLLRTRTVGPSGSGLGGDTGLGDRTVFDETTRPSAAEVEAVIDVAVGAIKARLSSTPPARLYPAVAHTVALYASLLIELSFFREQADEQATRVLEGVINSSVIGLNGQLDDVEGVSDVPRQTFGMLTVTSDRDHTRHVRPDSILDSDWEQSLIEAGVISWR
jgi:hypothetical protein